MISVAITGSGRNLFQYQAAGKGSDPYSSVLLPPPRKARKTRPAFQLPKEQLSAVAATWEERRLLKKKTLAVPVRGAVEMMKRSSPASSPLSWLLCMHSQALLSSAELQGQEQPLPAASVAPARRSV